MTRRDRDLFVAAIPVVGIPLVSIWLLCGWLWAYATFGAVLLVVGVIGTMRDADKRAKQYVNDLLARSRAMRADEV